MIKILKGGMLAMLIATCFTGMCQGADYGLPSNIQDGNILHCFDWTIPQVKAELQSIAEAGYGSVQLSPLQRPDARIGENWHALYRPYDLAFKSSNMGTEADLQSLCEEAAKYGIKIIVDVVANHVDKTAGYHDTWWDSNGRIRWNGNIDYNNRYSITHGQLGDYGDINSEDSEVIARAKAYVEKLKSLGVKGIRWDAAKHIGLPSEGCQFWSTMASVSGMYHYGEVLDAPGPNASIIKEYTNYMSVTDNQYSNGAARSNGGLPTGHAGSHVANNNCSDAKMVYWGESHDTYSNDEWSQNVDQSVIDRAYASFACRNGATALYFIRPDVKGFGNIKVGKGSNTAYKSKHITEVNKFRNAMVGKADYFSSNGSAISVTRKDGGAVIVMKGSGNVSIANGGGYCPAGTYTDRVSGGTFTVTSGTISGNVGSSGIAVLYNDGTTPNPNPNPDPTPDPDPTPEGEHYVYFDGTGFSQPMVWAWNDNGNCTVAGSWGGDNMTKKNGKWYWELPTGKSLPTMIIIHEGDNKIGGDDLQYVDKATYHQDGTYTAGSDPTPNPDPDPTTITIYYDNSVTNWSIVNCYSYANNAGNNGEWPGKSMTKVEDKIYSATIPGGSNVVFNNGNDQTVDVLNVVDKHVYKGLSEKEANNDGKQCNKVEDSGEYGGNTPVSKPVVTANPGSTTFSESITVSLSVSPATDIYYTTNGATPSTTSWKYTEALTFTETTTLKTYVKNEGGENVQTFTYTKSSAPEPDPTPANNLITDYYKVNPDGQCGTQKSINMQFNGQKSTTAMSNWSKSDIIAQGVARDVCQAFKGVHERPIIDSYALYAAYDNDNLYLGLQLVYTIWDIGGEGKQPGESKPYNMDGRLMWAFDLDPNKSFDGYINGTKAIWNDDNKPGAKFANGVDAVWIGSTKPGVGTPGFFIPTPEGHASYDAAYCKSISGSYYGYADGLHPTIDAIYGQKQFGYDPELLKGNTGFSDLTAEIDKSAHTFYEWKLPLSVLGVTADYIKNTGIGVMFLDIYGSSPVGGTPYDPSFFDNCKASYSMDPSSSKEKEDEDVITYSPARIGKINVPDEVDTISYELEESEAEPEYYTLQGVRISHPKSGSIVIVRKGNKVSKQLIR